ncbi:unnamed protein product, partial [Prorocentrum cordatum]
TDALNENVVEIMENGLSNIFVLKEHAPTAIQLWIKLVHNQYHHGSAVTLIQVYEQSPLAEKSWKQRAKANSITVDSCPKQGPHRYDKLYENHVISNFSDYFKFYDHFKKLVASYHKMVSLSAWSGYKEMCESSCEFLRKDLSNEAVASLNNDILVAANKIKDVIDGGLLNIIALEALKFAIPLEDEGFPWPPKWILRGAEKDSSKKRLAAMVLQEKAAKKQKGKGGICIPAEDTQTTVEESGKLREKVWLDDLVQAIVTPVSEIMKDAKMPEIRANIAIGLEFCFASEVTVDGVTYSKWSELRRKIVKRMVTAHDVELRRAGLDAAVRGEGAESQPHDDEGDDSQVSATAPSPRKSEVVRDMSEYVNDEKLVLKVSRFIYTNKTTCGMAMQPYYLFVSQNMVQSLSGLVEKDELTLNAALESFLRVTCKVFDDRTVCFIKRASKHIDSDDCGNLFSVADVTGGACNTKDEFMMLRSLRVRYCIGILSSMGRGALTDMATDSMKKLEAEFNDTVEIDISTPSTSWVELWSELIQAAASGDLRTHIELQQRVGAPAPPPAPTAAPDGEAEAADGEATSVPDSLEDLWAQTATTSAVIKTFIFELQAFIFRKCNVPVFAPPTVGQDDGPKSKMEANVLEAGWCDILWNPTPEKKDHFYVAKKVSAGIRLNFFGNVTRIQVPGSVKVARAFDMEFFVCSDGVACDPTMGDVLCPAWAIPYPQKAKAKADAPRKPDELQDPVLLHGVITLPFDFEYTVMNHLHKVTVDVSFHYL